MTTITTTTVTTPRSMAGTTTATGQVARLLVGSQIDGRDGRAGTVVGTRQGRPGRAAHDSDYLLVQQPWWLTARRTVRLVPMAWVRSASSAPSPMMLDADRAMVARCQPLRSDPAIRADVLASLAADPQLRPQRLVGLAAVRVAVSEGIVSLTGHVRRAAFQRVAQTCAQRVPGVLGVEDRIVADEAVAAGVAQALLRDPDLRVAQLLVTSRLGQVSLGGRLPSAAASATAAALAGTVPGVVAVRNDTTVTTPPP